MRLIVVALVAFLCISSPAAFAAEDAWRHRVSVDVTCKNEALRSQITSFIGRELRGLKDVDITDENPSFKISVVAIAVTLRSGFTAGYAFSVIITSPLGDWSWALSDSLKPEAKANITKMLAGHESLEDNVLLVGSDEDLRQSLTEIIAKFDANNLEPTRKLWQQLKDLKS